MRSLADIADIHYLTIHLDVKPDHLHTALDEIYKTISPTHKEDGCLEYRLLHNECSVVIFGKWKNKMSLQMHLLLQFHLQLVEDILPPLCDKISVQTYTEIEPPITALSLG